MKAIRVHAFGSPDVMVLEDAPTPTVGPEDVLVRVRAAGVNPVDTYVRAGSYARLPQLPFVPGKDGAGVVEAVGAEVVRLGVGDRVYIAGLGLPATGTYAEVAVCDQESVHRLPDGLEFEAGAAVGVPYVTAARAVFDRARLEPGETLLVHGASGAVGLAALQFARSAGAVTLGTAGSERGLDLVTQHGALAFDHHQAGYERRILDATGGRGVDVVVEMLANVNLVRDFDFLATGGRIVVVGNRGSLDFNPRLTMAKEASILGTQLWNLSAGDRTRLFARVNAALSTGVLRPVISRRLALDEAAEAHRAVLAPGAAGKIVLIP